MRVIRNRFGAPVFHPGTTALVRRMAGHVVRWPGRTFTRGFVEALVVAGVVMAVLLAAIALVTSL